MSLEKHADNFFVFFFFLFSFSFSSFWSLQMASRSSSSSSLGMKGGSCGSRTSPSYESLSDSSRTSSSSSYYGRCRSISEFDLKEVIGEGTYGRVWKAYDRRRDTIVAIKQLGLFSSSSSNSPSRRGFFSREGLPKTSVREIRLLKQLQHPNIVELLEVVCGPDVTEKGKARQQKSSSSSLKDKPFNQDIPYSGKNSVYLVSLSSFISTERETNRHLSMPLALYEDVYIGTDLEK
ncbi:cell-cycle-associated protein kinase [Cystoisospora suis]|uniref:Cell-cycle-associated protein kinase n=1 Tax=Cystoisospora suis TaxID=483139 RepID=A0A2C6KH29_9APIC|nr:cell-cycle-associated protein kinase [Cystoisospora suis]